MLLKIALVLSLALLILAGYVIWNLLRKIEIVEDFVVMASERAETTLRHMRALDNMEMFEQDDDVGIIFQQLVQIVEEYAEFLGVEEAAVEETE